MKFRVVHGIVIAAVLASLGLWSTDRITWDGERTIYTVQCLRGTWQTKHCTGELIAGPRIRYRAPPAHKEVIFWVAGSSEPSGKLTNCQIEDGRHWKCPESAESAKSITLEMVHGLPIHRSLDQPWQFHYVPKLSWTLLKLGLKMTDSAE